MIISASRRTDLPAFYSEWFIRRVRSGFCSVPNPFNSKQVSYISLEPSDVDAIVFWTRYSKPMHKYLSELNEHGYRYYFQYTVISYPEILSPRYLNFSDSLRSFKELSEMLGPSRVVWRYDPIVLSNVTDLTYHISNFERIASCLHGYTNRVVLSFVDWYKHVFSRLRKLRVQGINMYSVKDIDLSSLISPIVSISKYYGMDVFSCAEEAPLHIYGVSPGKCIDDALINSLFNIQVTHRKDTNQRKECGCVASRDIGMYDSCPYNCVYCYATRQYSSYRNSNIMHHPDSPSLLGWYTASTEYVNNIPEMKDLFNV